MLVMVDMDLGNLQSVLQAFRTVVAQVTVTTSPDDIARAAAVILPGVGAFGDGMASLRRTELVEPLRAHVLDRHKPLFGICLGMQLLADEGEEHGLHQGLGLIRGRVVRLKPAGSGHRVPNMGWCDTKIVNRGSVLFENVPDGEPFYFAHSYHLECLDPTDVAATIEYAGVPVVTGVERGNLFGVQFHPEKSQEAGLNLLAAFCDHVRRHYGG